MSGAPSPPPLLSLIVSLLGGLQVSAVCSPPAGLGHHHGASTLTRHSGNTQSVVSTSASDQMRLVPSVGPSMSCI